MVDHAVCGRPSFEWGGQDESGADVFTELRPGWTHGPVHDLLRDAGVRLVLHGHDHLFALQEYEGVVYLLCPQAADASYGYGAMDPGQYAHGHLLPNAGHLRFQVSPEQLAIEYVRAYRPGDGPNGTVAFQHVLYPDVTSVPGLPGVPGMGPGPHSQDPGPLMSPILVITPSLWTGEGFLELRLAAPGEQHSPGGPFPDPRDAAWGAAGGAVWDAAGAAAGAAAWGAAWGGGPRTVRVFDPQGRCRAQLPLDPLGRCRWDGRDGRGQILPSGRYFCHYPSAGEARAGITTVSILR